jgi:hypothetical protein
LSRQLKRSQTKGKIPMPLVLQAVRRKLNAPSCCNQGYVLDSFPETHQQATHLFKKLPSVDDEEGAEPDDEEIPEWVDEDENTEGGGEEDAEEPAYEEEDDELAEGVEPPKEGKVFTPAHLVVVDATDEHLQATVKDLSEAEIVATYESEDGFVDQLAKWRAVQEKKPCVTGDHETAPATHVRSACMTSHSLLGRLLRVTGHRSHYSPGWRPVNCCCQHRHR